MIKVVAKGNQFALASMALRSHRRLLAAREMLKTDLQQSHPWQFLCKSSSAVVFQTYATAQSGLEKFLCLE